MKRDPLLMAILGLLAVSIPVDAWANWRYGIAAVLQWAIFQLVVVLVVLRVLGRPSRLPG